MHNFNVIFQLACFHTHTVWYLSHPARQTSFFDLFWGHMVILNILSDSTWHAVTFAFRAHCQTVDWQAHKLFELNAVVVLRRGEGKNYFTHYTFSWIFHIRKAIALKIHTNILLYHYSDNLGVYGKNKCLLILILHQVKLTQVYVMLRHLKR